MVCAVLQAVFRASCILKDSPPPPPETFGFHETADILLWLRYAPRVGMGVASPIALWTSGCPSTALSF